MQNMRTIGSGIVAILLVSVFLLGASEPMGTQGGAKLDGATADTAPMILIAEGDFTMGTDDVGSGWQQGNPNEHPEHIVTLKSYYIDQFEVTIARYAKFIQATNHGTPPSWDEDAVALRR